MDINHQACSGALDETLFRNPQRIRETKPWVRTYVSTTLSGPRRQSFSGPHLYAATVLSFRDLCSRGYPCCCTRQLFQAVVPSIRACDYRSCLGSHAVGPRHAFRQRLTKPRQRSTRVVRDAATGQVRQHAPNPKPYHAATVNRPPAPPPGGVFRIKIGELDTNTRRLYDIISERFRWQALGRILTIRRTFPRLVEARLVHSMLDQT